MSEQKTRISKAPEVRKEEIINISMAVFAEKGYEQTTMRDIAAAVGVVPGLCYRYFESKQALYHEALSKYIMEYCAPIISELNNENYSYDEMIKHIAFLFIERDGKEKYHSFFHKKENHDLHILMSHSICEYMEPFVAKYLTMLKINHNLSIDDTNLLAKFILFGQIPIINDPKLSSEEKIDTILLYFNKLLK